MWVFVGMALNNGIRLLSNLLLTRLLAPDLYGLMSVGNVIVGALIMLSDIGLAQSVIQSPRGAEPRFLNTIWTVKVVRGVLMAAVLGSIALALTAMRLYAPWMLSGSYADPRLVQVLLVLVALPLVDGFESTTLIVCKRAVDLKPIVLVEVGSQVLSTALMAAMALIHPSVWVLPAGWVLFALFKTLASFFITGTRNTFCWDGAIAREVWHFSKWILFSSVLTYVYRDGDRLILGGLLNAHEMGIYGVCVLLLSAVKTVVGSLAGNVGMPALAEVARSRPADLASAYRRCRNPIDLVCLGVAGLLFGGADFVIGILYDQRYQDAAPIFRLVALLLISHRYILFDYFLVATGETKQLFKRGVLQVVVMLVGLPVGYHFNGMTGAVWGLLASNFAIVPLIWWLEARAGLFDWRAEVKVLPAFAVGALAGYMPVLTGLYPFH
jgi:O-antigen/teichoic acid export membrane protein